MSVEVKTGKPYPLGATWENGGVNLAMFSEHATSVILCLYKSLDDVEQVIEVVLPKQKNYVHHGFINGIQPGQLYGYRIEGPYAPEEGHRYNRNKLLLDPYAKAVAGRVMFDDACFGYQKETGDDASFDEKDSAPFVPRSVVTDCSFDWEGDTLLDGAYQDFITYEMHVKGFSQLLPGIPENLQGKYGAIAHPTALAYFRQLGINAIELLPVQFSISSSELEEKGLTNYWGYDTLGYFALHPKYSSGTTMQEQLAEFKNMVKVLHKEGIEVILDVVYNHTGEGTELGPTLCFRGIDNLNYYRLEPDDKRRYVDFTGTGNTLDTRQPWTLQLIMDSLRYWVTEMHVDGFRFDLAPALGRDAKDVDWVSSFFTILYQDPILCHVKLIAEPWDVGNEGYQVGRFPSDWAEWNGKYRDTMRNYWRRKSTDLHEFLLRFFGSPDLYKHNGRTPGSSINFVTAHDGYTLHDLTTYEQKHNEANGNDNEDGSDDNKSENWGVEGETNDAGINKKRKQHQKNLLATLLLSQGVPMLRAGDEMGHTQKGNNNGYNHDNETTWINWETGDKELIAFTSTLTRIRKQNPVISQQNWFFVKDDIRQGTAGFELFAKDGQQWFFKDAKGQEASSVGILFKEAKAATSPEDAADMKGVLFIIFNNAEEKVEYVLPKAEPDHHWMQILDTQAHEFDKEQAFEGDSKITIQPYSILVLRQ